MDWIRPVQFETLPPRDRSAPVKPDHDPGDEHCDSRWISFPRSHVRCEGIIEGVYPPLFYEHYYIPVGEDQDGGDEDDYHNYLPSVDRRIGLRCWWPRDGLNPRGYF